MTPKRRLAESVIHAAGYLKFFDLYALVRRDLNPLAVIVGYHRVGDLTNPWSLPPIRTRDFEEQIKYLSKVYKVLSLDELIRCIQEKSLPQKAAVITFDDGYKCVYKYCYPILKKYKVPATIFLTTGHIGRGDLFWWDKVRYVIYNTPLESIELKIGKFPLRSIDQRLKAAPKIARKLMKITEKEKNQLIKELISKSGVNIPDLGKELILSWEEVKEMSNSGITFGAHTVTHAILTKVPLAQARYEILQSKKEIEEKIGRPVSAFSYPYGGFEDLNDEIINLLKESGFICAVTCIPKTVHYKVNPYKLGRILPEVKSGCDLNHFKLMLLVSRLYTGITLSRAGGK